MDFVTVLCLMALVAILFPRFNRAGLTASRPERCPPTTPGCEGPAGRPPSDRPARLLAPDPQSRDHGLVSLLIIPAEIIQHAPPPAHPHPEPASRTAVLPGTPGRPRQGGAPVGTAPGLHFGSGGVRMLGL